MGAVQMTYTLKQSDFLQAEAIATTGGPDWPGRRFTLGIAQPRRIPILADELGGYIHKIPLFAECAHVSHQFPWASKQFRHPKIGVIRALSGPWSMRYAHQVTFQGQIALEVRSPETLAGIRFLAFRRPRVYSHWCLRATRRIEPCIM